MRIIRIPLISSTKKKRKNLTNKQKKARNAIALVPGKKVKGWKPVQTTPEKIIAKVLRDAGFNVTQNKRLHGYFPDIRINGTKLLIEVDGLYHFTPEQKEKDRIRTENLEENGYQVIRFTNKEAKQPTFIVNSVKKFLNIPHPSALPTQATPTARKRKTKDFIPGRLLKHE